MVEDIINNGNVKYKGSILEKYYSTYKPYTFKELYFINQKPIISDKQDSRILNENLNYYKYDLWSDERQKVQMDRVHEYGLLRSHGTQHFGPVSIQKGELELQRLKDTYHSILKYGHLPNKFGFISGYFLRYKNRYRFIILDGNHRAAVLCAMGYSKIPVTFQAGSPRIIDYNDIKNFPHVKRGLFSLPLAKQIFKTYFEDDGTKKARNLGLIN
ncbi:hypothetical protein J2S74_004005 [Evansella vedderi]|uniref:ParB/Sulfiredoxin domain-containing protein n=1 Tax=Evansella vedderi TaxID=38282 RepID=A0ABU0A1J7_9BACI|nr:hypothetical protein [Evansella vedderi]MDQ0256583.1 hypothetical protein [Evansella vedderi]